jgi:hypothetical protein
VLCNKLESFKTDIRNIFRTHVFKINLKQCVGWDSAVDPMGACCINLIFRASTSRQVASLSSTSWKRRLEEEVTRCVGDAFIAPAGWSSLSRWVIHWASKRRRAVRAASRELPAVDRLLALASRTRLSLNRLWVSSRARRLGYTEEAVSRRRARLAACSSSLATSIQRPAVCCPVANGKRDLRPLWPHEVTR